MTKRNRHAPDTEWVEMYRSGIRAPKIAAVAGVPETTVRYHLAIAAGQDPSVRSAHKAAVSKAHRMTSPGRKNRDEVLAFFEAEGRLPSRGTDRERALATWLQRRRKEAAEGRLSPAYARALDSIPNWRKQSTRRDTDVARWKQRLGEVAAYLATGKAWPRHHRTEDQDERTLGIWLHTQRIDYRAGKLDSDKEKQLDEVIPGWRQGRARRSSNTRRNDVRSDDVQSS